MHRRTTRMCRIFASRRRFFANTESFRRPRIRNKRHPFPNSSSRGPSENCSGLSFKPTKWQSCTSLPCLANGRKTNSSLSSKAGYTPKSTVADLLKSSARATQGAVKREILSRATFRWVTRPRWVETWVGLSSANSQIQQLMRWQSKIWINRWSTYARQVSTVVWIARTNNSIERNHFLPKLHSQWSKL